MEDKRSQIQKLKNIGIRYSLFMYILILVTILTGTIYYSGQITEKSAKYEANITTETFDQNTITRLRNLEKPSDSLKLLEDARRTNPFTE